MRSETFVVTAALAVACVDDRSVTVARRDASADGEGRDSSAVDRGPARNLAGGGSGASGTSSNGGATSGGGANGSGGSGNAGGTSAGGQTSAGGSGGNDAAVDGSGCDGTVCGGQCVDVASSEAHCGECDHDCGGGECDRGACQPQILQADLPTLGGIAVDAKQVYFTRQTGNIIQATSSVASCPVTGCTLMPAQIAGNFVSVGAIAVTPQGLAFVASKPTTGGPALGLALIPFDDSSETDLIPTASQHTAYLPTLVASGNYIYYRRLNGVTTYLTYRCIVSNGACTENVQMQTSSDLTNNSPTPFVAVGAKLFFVQNGNLVRCDADTGCASTTPVLANFSGTVLRASANTLYFATSSLGSISSCPEAGCATKTDIIAFAGTNGTELAVDGAGVYWVSGTTIRGCRLPNCPGGPIELARNQYIPASLVADGQFVYWMTGLDRKADGGITPNTATIARVRHW